MSSRWFFGRETAPLLRNSKAGRDPIEDEFIGQRRVIGVSLCCRGFLTGEYLQVDVAAIALQAVIKLAHAFCLEPAALARANQDRAFDVSGNPAGDRGWNDIVIPRGNAIPQERAFVNVPDASVTNCGCEAVIERDSPGHEGR